MKFDWCEYFRLAQELANVNAASSDELASNSKQQTSEAKLRSCVSRAYYSAFCISRNYLRDVLHDPRLSKARTGDVNEHQYVADEFIYNNAKNKKLIQIGNDLRRLREYRNKSDYDDKIFNLEKEVKFALKLAGSIIDNINELSKDVQ